MLKFEVLNKKKFLTDFFNKLICRSNKDFSAFVCKTSKRIFVQVKPGINPLIYAVVF